MAINTAASIGAGDIETYIQDQLLPLPRRQVVAYQFGEPLTLIKGHGNLYTAIRFQRLPLPSTPLVEGVPPPSRSLAFQTVTGATQQWGDRVLLTDVAEMTVKHPLISVSIELLGLQITETFDRNVFNTLLTGTQVNTVNGHGRTGLLTTDLINMTEVQRMSTMLTTLGAPRFGGDTQTTAKVDAAAGESSAASDPRSQPHYVAIMHPFVEGDARQTNLLTMAWSYSDVNKLYNNEIGEFGGVRFCKSNLVPSILGAAQATGSPVVGGGSFAAANYYIVVTGSDTQNQYESYVSQTSAAITVALNGSITLTTPAATGYTYNVYVGTVGNVVNLGLSPNGPTTGPLAGNATQIPPSTVITLTGIGAAQVPPVAPPSGITMYPTFFFGRGAYGVVTLDQVKVSTLLKADKADPLNQLRSVGWKAMYGTMITNNTFMARLESTSSMSLTFA